MIQKMIITKEMKDETNRNETDNNHQLFYEEEINYTLIKHRKAKR